MATFIPVPGVAQTVVTAHIAGHKANMVWHFSHGGTGPWNGTDLNTLVNTLFGSLNTRMKTTFASNVVFNNIAAVDLTNDTPAIATSTGAQFNCTGIGPATPSLCFMVNFNIAKRYKGGHPRTYMPPLASNSMSAGEDQWQPANITTALTNFANVISDVTVAIPGATNVVPLYNYTVSTNPSTGKVTREKDSLKGVFVVTSYTGNPPIRSQRRRMTSAA
jgi:hypothetical protein